MVVDNGSSDRTREVVEQRAGDPRLKYVFEPTIGLSVARNTGARVASAEILAYLDDDAVASPHWLQVLYSAYKNNSKSSDRRWQSYSFMAPRISNHHGGYLLD